MPRPITGRCLRAEIRPRLLRPVGILVGDLEETRLGLDEAEALRLADLEGLYHEAAARKMGVSRATFGRILESARKKVADAIVNGKALRLAGGEIVISGKGDSRMKIALPSRDGAIDDHFGHCKAFAVFSVTDGKLTELPSIPSLEGCGCKSGVAATLAQEGITHLVAGNMGEGAVRVLGSHGISVIRGASGSVKTAAEAFAAGRLADSGILCSSHDEHGEHECHH